MLLKKWLREPLLHFLLIGAAIFLLYGLQNQDYISDDNRIVISKGNIDRLIALWEKKRQRPPTQTELQRMIEQQVREEVLYREALAMGLGKNDIIVRKRLAQKIEFISTDIAAMAEPDEKQLKDFFTANRDKFEKPAALSFGHIYFNRDKRGVQTEADALTLLTKLKQSGVEVDINIAGDSFMLGQKYNEITKQGVTRLFGEDFSANIFKLKLNNWQGPVKSSYGAHLVYITKKSTKQAVELNSVRDKVITEWRAKQRHIQNETFYKKLRERYDVVIENVSTVNE